MIVVGFADRISAVLLPDRAALCGSDPSGADQANRFIMVLLALQRVAYLFPAGVSAANGTHRSPTLHLLLLFTAVAWNVALFRSALRRHPSLHRD